MLRTSREIGMALRRLREEAGMSQVELASLAGVSRRWLLDFENGKPSVDLSKVLDCFAALGAGLDVAANGEHT